MIELHYAPGNASMAPHMLLRELGLPFRLQLVDRSVEAHKGPAYLALNPNGHIPVLVDGGQVIYETAAICLHLADQRPDAGLMPPLGSAERGQAYKWLAWMSNTLQVRLMHYFYPERVVNQADSPAAAEVRAQAQAHIGELLGQLETQLTRHGGQWLLGTQFSLVDLYGLMLCRWTRGFEGTASPPARNRPLLAPWLQRVLQRPAVQAALAAEGLVAPFV
jgi:glutathione S-transferase